MRSFFRLICTFFLFIIWTSTQAQKYELYGKVLNSETKEVIPFANIAIKDIYKGTASNALGEFSFKVDSLPLNLVISHLSYESLEITVNNSDELIIELIPGKLVMDELVIKGAGSSSFAYELVRKAYYQVIGKGKAQRYGNAFYRQISKNGDEFSELYEIFYDTRYSNNGVEDWAIQEGRYALKLSTVDSFIYNKNFTHMVRLLTVVQPKTEDLIMPLSESVYEQYDLTTDRIISVNNRNVAQISFKKKEEVSFPALEGEIHIDTESYEVLKLNGSIVDDNLNFISLTGKKSSWKNYVVNCEIAFKRLDEEQLALDYMQLQQNFDYYVDDAYVNKVETKSFFTYYEYYVPPKRKKLGGRLIRFNQRDSDVLDAVGYNQLFWDENIIVKRTPIEAEVIESFEQERAFGSIYLNNKNQLILEDYEIDNDPFILHVRNQLKNYDLPQKGEKVYIHHDKPAYLAGEDLWFRAYVVNMATNSPAAASQTLHVNVISPEGAVISSSLFEIENGVSSGRIQLPESSSSGAYKLVAYTDWMMNFDPKLFYSQNLTILDKNDETGFMAKTLVDSVSTLKMFPEGGDLVNNMPGQVGFVATNKFDETIDLRGRLLNHIGRQVAPIKSAFNGFGSMFMLPQKDIKYRTMIMTDEFHSDEFPPIKEEGYTTMINTLKQNTIDITVRGTPNYEGKKIYLLTISNGVLFDRRIGMLTRGLYKTEIPKSNMPSGMTQILLVDEMGNIVNKRLIFLNQPEAATVKYYLPKKEFKPNERVDMVIEVNDENGRNIGFSNISVSVVDKDKISRNENDRNIKSYLTFEHALDYDLNEAGSLFNDFDRETLKNIDYVMLNQQTTLPEIKTFKKDEQEEKQVNFSRHRHIAISGVARSSTDGQPLVNGYLSFISRPDSRIGSWYVKTNSSGAFNLKGVNSADSTKVAVMALDQNGNEVSVDVQINAPGILGHIEAQKSEMIALDNELKRYLNALKDIDLAVGKNDKIERSEYDRSKVDVFPFGRPSQSIQIDEKYAEFTNLGQLLSSRLPGTVMVDNEMRIRGKSARPVFMLDGVLLSLDQIAWNSPAEKYASIPLNNISQIDVIKEPEEVLVFDQYCENGIIAIYSKEGMNILQNYESELLTEVFLPGYQSIDEFYSPGYSNSENVIGNDRRTTIYWNPNITTNRKGRAKISFYNSDDARNFQICVEGITQDGIPIFDLYDFGRNYGKSKRSQY